MRLIIRDIDFEMISEVVSSSIDKEAKLPQKVFNKSFKNFLFVTFNDLFIPELCFSSIKKILSKMGESHFWLSSICPDPKSYYHSLFGFYGTMEFSLSDKESDFLKAITEYPKENPADAFIHNSRVLVSYSQSSSWIFYADRDSDIGIFVFKDKKLADILTSIYPDGIFSDAEAAADYMFDELPQEHGVKTRFLENYS